MAVKHKLTYTYSGGLGSVSGIPAVELTGDSEFNSEYTVPAGATNYVITKAFADTQILMMLISSSEAITIKTNSTSAPDDEIAAAAKSPIVWYTGLPSACPITAPVTSLHVANPGSVDAVLKIFLLLDNAA